MTIVVEAYPAQNFSSDQNIPFPLKNPAHFAVSENGVITGLSERINTIAGRTRITGGHADFNGRQISIAPQEAGLDHFRMQSWPIPTETLSPQQCRDRGLTRNNTNNACLLFEAKKQNTIYLVAAADKSDLKPFEMTASQLRPTLENLQKKYLNSRLNGAGSLGVGVEPMINELLWNACYNPFEKQVFIPAGRPWMSDGKYNLWGWDENLCAAVASLVSYDIAATNTVLANADERLGPYACWYVYCHHDNIDLLKKCYPVYREIYPPCDDAVVLGGGQYNGNVGKGMDDTPMREHWRKLGEMYSLDMTCIKAWNLQILAKMASVLGNTQDAVQYLKSAESLVSKINTTFWNENEGIYRNRYVSGEWPVTESPTSFYPWLAGAPDAAQSERLLKKLLDESRFWGRYVIPSLAKDDPQFGKEAFEKHQDRFFPPYCYWRGTIWPPTNYLVYEGLKRAGHDEVAAAFAEKTVDMWHSNWLQTGGFPENFDPVTGKRSVMAHKHQTWSTLFPMLGLKELIDVEIWSEPGTIRFGSFVKGINNIFNYSYRGHTYNLKIEQDKMLLERDQKILVEAIPGRCVIRDFKCTDSQVWCRIHTTSEQLIRFYLKENQKPLEVKIPAGSHSITLPSK